MKHSISPKTGTGSLGTLWCLIEGGIGIVGGGGVGGGSAGKITKTYLAGRLRGGYFFFF